jgi:large subunit ribosomal protein L10
VTREEKRTQVAELTSLFKDADCAIFVNPIGQTVAQSTDLRARIFQADASLRVVRNRLTYLALKDADKSEFKKFVEGPTAVATSTQPVELAKAMVEFRKEKANKDKLEIRGGWLFNKMLDEKDVIELSKLPPLPQMRAKLLGTLNAPISNFVGLLGQLPASFVRVVKAIADQKAAAGE